MMATTTAEVIVLRPPAPRLGNFDKVFSTYLEKISNNEPKIAFTLPDFDELWGLEKSNKRGRNANIDKLTPERQRLDKAAQSLFYGRIKEFVPSPPQAGYDGFDLPPVTPSDVLAPSPSNDFTNGSTPFPASVFDSGHYTTDSAATTPMGTPATLKYMSPGVFRAATPTIDCGEVFVSTRRKRAAAASYHPSALSACDNGVADSQNTTAVSSQHRAHVLPHQMAPPHQPATELISSDGTFRYSVSSGQSYGAEGITMYSAAFAKPGNPDCIVPNYMCAKQEKMEILQYKLSSLLLMDREFQVYVPPRSKNVHVFVDLSNITIGFYDALKIAHGVPITKRMKAPRFCFEHFAHVLERGRHIEKRVVVGSLLTAYARKWPDYMEEGRQLGYEMNIMQRVPKPASPAKKYRTVRRPNGDVEWTTSDGDSPDEDVIMAGQLKQGEQGVDETLHLKMCQSALDSKPGIAVIATGDAAEAEYSDGFRSNAERLLEQGWNIEVVGWSKGLSKAWKDTQFTQKWGDRVRVIELDYYVEEIYGAWLGAPGY